MSKTIIEIERCLLGALIGSPGTVAVEDLEEDDFLAANHRKIFSVIRSNLDQVDPVRIASILETQDPGKNWLEEIVALCEASYGPRAIQSYLEEIKRHSKRRQFDRILSEAREKLAGTDINTHLSATIGELMRLANKSSAGGSAHQYDAKTMIQAAIDEIERDVYGDIEETRVLTGLAEFDEQMGGFHNTDLVIIGGRPAMGKTAMMVSCILAARDMPVGVISTEMTAAQMGVRSIAAYSRVPSFRLRRQNGLSEEDIPKINMASQDLARRKIWINDRASIHITDIICQAQIWKHEHDIKILFVDYLQRIKGGTPSMPKHEQIDEIVRGLKQIAKELEIPVVALAQVKREVENRPNKRPLMSDLKDSGAIEQEADMVMLLYRDEVYNPDTEDQGIAEIIVAKHRHGPVGTIRVGWNAQCTLFHDLDDMYDDDDDFEQQTYN